MKKLLALMIVVIYGCNRPGTTGYIMTVNGPVSASDAGLWLTHEHVLVDFIGADSITPDRYDRTAVITGTLPFLKRAKELGCITFVECTPEYLGRDPLILKALSDSTGLNIITNTGFYGANNNKYIPAFAFKETAEQLSQVWINEWEKGIGDTGIKPGFIKIAVGTDTLSEFHTRLVRAAALTHLATGLTVASHTGPSLPAFQQIEILKKEGVSPDAFIWVHAQAEKDISSLAEGASAGAWISLDNVSDDNVNEYLSIIKALNEKGLLNKILLSHDAGWYDPGKENGGDIRGFTTLFEKLIPAMKSEGFSDVEVKQLLEINPSEAFKIKVRKLNK